MRALLNSEVVLMNILHYTNFFLNEVSENAFINIKMLNKRVRGIVTDIIIGNFLLLAFVMLFSFFFFLFIFFILRDDLKILKKQNSKK